MQPAPAYLDTQRRVHHHDKDDAETLGVIAYVRVTSRRFFAIAGSSISIAALATRYRLCYGDAIGFGRKG